jgi:hypothetical protein
MIIAVILGFVVGILCIAVRDAVGGTENGGWKIVDALLFQDITKTTALKDRNFLYNRPAFHAWLTARNSTSCSYIFVSGTVLAG